MPSDLSVASTRALAYRLQEDERAEDRDQLPLEIGHRVIYATCSHEVSQLRTGTIEDIYWCDREGTWKCRVRNHVPRMYQTKGMPVRKRCHEVMRDTRRL